MDSDQEEGAKKEERIVVKSNRNRKDKRKQWKGNQYDDKKEVKLDYGNSYGRKGQTNNLQLITNDDLRASMW